VENTMQVADVMTRDVRIASPTQSLQEVARIMIEIDAGLLPVGENDRLVGMITDRDIAVRAVAQGLGPDTTVREVMSQDVKYCFDDQDTAEVGRSMADERVRRLPVLNRQKRLVGILSLGDIAITAGGQAACVALEGISMPGGDHSQGGGPAANPG
jgi:CBS domain-containing protein